MRPLLRPAASLSLASKLRWVALLYLVEGLPFGIILYTLPIYFKDSGVPNHAIGLMAGVLAAPYALKLLWSPLIDRWPDYRRWIVGSLAALAVLTACVPAFDPSRITPTLWVLLVGMAVVSATQDIAIDAYTVRLVARGEEGQANSIRVSAYRVALILAKAVLLSQVTNLGYAALLWITAVSFLVLASFVWFLPRPDPRWERGREGLAAIIAGVRSWLALPGSLGVLLFILLYNLSDITIAPMIPPFWLDAGYEVEEMGWVYGGGGVALTIAGALAGGWIISRIGIFHGLWTLGLSQGASNLGYTAAAWWELGRPGVYGASALESFTDGLGSAALLAFLMRLCDKEWAATQYALLSAVFALTKTVFGAPSGWAAERMGYGPWFFTTFLLGFVMFAFLPSVRRRLRRMEA